MENYFKDTYTTVTQVNGSQCITRDWFRLMEERALVIVELHGLKYDPRDPQSSAEYWGAWEGDFFQINAAAPGLTIGELGQLLMYNYMVLNKAKYENKIDFIQQMWI